MREYILQLQHLLQDKGMVKTCVILDGPNRGRHLIWSQEGILYEERLIDLSWEYIFPNLDQAETSNIIQIHDLHCFVEKFSTSPKLIILGGGHVSLPVAQLGKMLEYEVIVVDDRPEFANQERFFMVDTVLCSDYEKVFEMLEDYPNSYYVIVTPGHKKDYLCVSYVLKRHYSYVGMIGSKAKVAICKKQLLEDGFTQEKINEIHAPIGIDIGAQTPAEIAVSVLGEIIQLRNQERISVLESDVKEGILSALEPHILATIVKKTGSSPRGASSRMLVNHDGIIKGTIGGGAVENATIQKAKEMLEKGEAFALEEYILSNTEGASLGMICGGNITVCFEEVNIR